VTAAPTPAVSGERFRAAMGRWTTGVTVVTANDGADDAGMTVNAFLSVALEPPSVLVSLQREVDTLAVVRRARRFGVSVLASDQRELSRRFALAAPAAEKFRGVPVHRTPSGVPLLDGALLGLECRLVSEAPAFDHVLVVGEVVRLEDGPDAVPLVFFRGQYADREGDDRLRFGRRSP
jgi:3-hydroxy-9,10-secoandrosta-1,3,5(10)-triene-9,17-dione monooxygenase reductase component